MIGLNLGKDENGESIVISSIFSLLSNKEVQPSNKKRLTDKETKDISSSIASINAKLPMALLVNKIDALFYSIYNDFVKSYIESGISNNGSLSICLVFVPRMIGTDDTKNIEPTKLDMFAIDEIDDGLETDYLSFLCSDNKNPIAKFTENTKMTFESISMSKDLQPSIESVYPMSMYGQPSSPVTVVKVHGISIEKMLNVLYSKFEYQNLLGVQEENIGIKVKGIERSIYMPNIELSDFNGDKSPLFANYSKLIEQDIANTMQNQFLQCNLDLSIEIVQRFLKSNKDNKKEIKNKASDNINYANPSELYYPELKK